METKTVMLAHPIERGEKSFTKITIRKPSTSDLRGISLGQLALMHTDVLLALLPRIIVEGLTGPEIAKMDFEDFFTCAAAITDFLPASIRMSPD